MSTGPTRDRSYTLGGVINTGIARALATVHTAMPGRVVRYDAALGQVDVKPLVQVSYLDEQGDTITESLPVVTCVPIMFPGAGGFRITFPVKAGDKTGDTVLLIFSEVSLDRWLAGGGNDVDPGDQRRFHLTDGVALLGLRDFAHPHSSVPQDHCTIGKDDGLQLHIDGTSIRIGADDAPSLDAATLGTAAATALTNIVSWLTSHTHPVTGAVAGVSATPAPTIPDVKSTSVMVKK